MSFVLNLIYVPDILETKLIIHITMKQFNSLDHYILSSVLFDSAVGDLRVQHDADNLSDNDPIFTGLSLYSNIHAMSDKIHHAKVAWHKCTDADLTAYGNFLSVLLLEIFICQLTLYSVVILFCVNSEHVSYIHRYATDPTE